MHPIAPQDSNRREAQGGYLDGGFLSCSLTSPNPRGEYVAQASARPKGRFYTLKHRSCCSSGGSDTAIPFSPYHTQLGRQSWFPPLGRMETPNLTTLWRRERLHPLSTSQPASQRPRSLGSCTVRARGAWCLSRVCSLEGYKRFFLLSSALNSLPCQLQNTGLERNVDIIAKQCIQFP